MRASIFQSSLTRLMSSGYLALMLPCDVGGWHRGVLDQASDVDGAACVQIDFAFAQDCGYGNCNGNKDIRSNGLASANCHFLCSPQRPLMILYEEHKRKHYWTQQVKKSSG